MEEEKCILTDLIEFKVNFMDLLHKFGSFYPDSVVIIIAPLNFPFFL